MSAIEISVEVSLFSSEFEHQALMITVSNDYEEIFHHKARSLIFLIILLPLLKIGSFHVVLTPLELMELKFEKPILGLLYLLYMIQKLREKI